MSLSRNAALSAVAKKARGAENSAEEIRDFVAAYCADELDEQLMIDWLRAVMTAGMSFEETAALTDVMAASGKQLDWSRITAPLADKHSTGGVGDDVSLIAVPLAAACGVKVAKLSGGALGHTGGTLDKLACIPGMRSALSMQEFKQQVSGSVGCAIAQASAELAPADKKLYQLRHRTGTIASVPLITASVLSKKIAGGAPNLVIDVKAGRCAFMQSREEAQALAKCLFEVGTRLGRRMEILITEMDAPLANSIGDALELDEAIATLERRSVGRLRDAALAVATAMVALASREDEQAARGRVERALDSKAAELRFNAMVAAQGGDAAGFTRAFVPALELNAKRSGFIGSIDGRLLGTFVARHKHHDRRAGLRLLKRRGEAVAKGEPLLQVFAISPSQADERELEATVQIGPNQIREPEVVLGRFAA